MRAVLLVAVVALSLNTSACKGCRSDPHGGEARASASASASASGAPRAEPPGVPTTLPPRRPAVLRRPARSEVVAGIARARELVPTAPKEALVVLAEQTRLDPTGGLLAVELARAALAAKDEPRARDWARRALLRGAGNDSVREAALRVLKGAAPAPELDGTFGAPTKSPAAACAALVAEVRAGKSRALGLASATVGEVSCQVGVPRTVSDKAVKDAVELRLTLDEGGRTEASWVGLTTPSGVVAYGPLARVHTPKDHDLVNGYTLRLDPLDALAGGAREVAVTVDERTSVADVALDEVFERDLTRVVVLTVDRGGITASPPAVIFDRQLVRRATPGDAAEVPTGYTQSALLTAPRTERFRLRWDENAIVVLAADAARSDLIPERRIVLFP